MTEFWLMVLSALRGVIELLGLCLLGQGVLALIAGSQRTENSICRLLVLLTRPLYALLRFVLPRQILDRHLPILGFFLLLWLWITLAYLRTKI